MKKFSWLCLFGSHLWKKVGKKGSLEHQCRRCYKVAWVNVCLALCLGTSAIATPFYFQGYARFGVAQTNIVTMQVWPPQNYWTAYGTNLVYGGDIITNVPNAGGFFSNAVYPNTYRVYVPALNSAFFVVIPDTTNYLSLTTYATNVAPTQNPLSTFGIITNLLGYAPVQPTTAAVISALGYTPVSNTYAALTNVAGFVIATNTPGLNTNLQFTALGVTNTAYITNGILKRITIP